MACLLSLLVYIFVQYMLHCCNLTHQALRAARERARAEATRDRAPTYFYFFGPGGRA
jgi:hypothetical protein